MLSLATITYHNMAWHRQLITINSTKRHTPVRRPPRKVTYISPSVDPSPLPSPTHQKGETTLAPPLSAQHRSPPSLSCPKDMTNMSSSSLFSTSSSSSSSSSFSSPSFPSSAMAATRQRRKRRDAISRAVESDWDASPTTAAVGPHDTATIPPWHTDELICPLAPSSVPLPPSTFLSLAGPTDEDVGDLQAMLARFTFPSPPPTSRKHRRSGESVDHTSANVNATVPGTTADTSSGYGNGPVKRAPCAHCACERTSM